MHPRSIASNSPDELGSVRAPLGAERGVPDQVIIDGWLIDTVGGVLSRGPDEVRLTRRTTSVLRVLLGSLGTTVSRERLIQLVWPDSAPTDDVVTKAVRELRQALGDSPKGSRFVETIPRIGYRFAAAVDGVDSARDAVMLGGYGDGPSDADSSRVRDSHQDYVIAEPAAMDEDTVAERPQRMNPSSWRWVWLVVLAAAAVAAVLVWRNWRQPAPVTPSSQPAQAEAMVGALQRQLITGLRPLTALPGTEIQGSLSPDGRAVAYSARENANEPYRVFIAPVDTLDRRRLSVDETPNANELAAEWSPDGQQIAFQRISKGACGVFLFAVTGRGERRVADCDSLFTQYLEFTPDGKQLALFRAPDAAPQTPARLHLLDLVSGKVTPFSYAIDDDPFESDFEARYSHDGAWLAIRRGRPPHNRLYLLPAGGGKGVPLLQQAYTLAGFDWLPDSQSLLVAAGLGTASDLWLVHRDGGGIDRIGAARVRWPRFAQRAPVAVFMQSDEHGVLNRLSLSNAETASAVTRSFVSSYTEQFPDFDANSRRVAFVSNRSGLSQLHIGSLDQDDTEQLTHFDSGAVAWPRWSDDGREIVFTHSNLEGDTIHIVRVGDRYTREIATGLAHVRQADISADAASVVVDALTPTGWRVFRVARSDGRREPLFDGTALAPQRLSGSEDVIAVDPHQRGLLRLSPGKPPQSLLDGRIADWNRWAWDATARGIYYVWSDDSTSFRIYFRPWGSGEDHVVARIPRILPSYGLAVDESTNTALIGTQDPGNSDLVLLTLEAASRQGSL